MEENKSMLLGLKLRNFKSYKDEAEFSFNGILDDTLADNYTDMTLEDESTIRVMNTAVILGANASGKSNLIWGFRALSYIVRRSRDFERNRRIPAYESFAFDERTVNSPVEMELSIIVKGRHYLYEIAFDNIIRKEILSEIYGNNKVSIFERSIDNGDFHHIELGEGWNHDHPEWITMDLMKNHLLLSEISSKKAYELNDIYETIAYINVYVDPVNTKELNDNVAPNILQSNNSVIFQRLVRLIRIADLGIGDVKMIRHDDNEFNFPEFVSENQRRRMIEDNRWEFRMYHKYFDKENNESEKLWALRDESMGTQHLFGLGAVVLNVLEVGGLLAFDELNMTLHPEITRLLVGLFQNEETNPHHAQLLFSTHDASIIGESLLRADQVWLAEKDNDGCSHLYSVQDFEDVSIIPPMEKWYRSGRFGALPKIKNEHYIFSGEVLNETEKETQG